MKVVSTSPSFAKYSNEPIEFLRSHQIEFEYLPADITEAEFIEKMQGVNAAIVAFNTISEKVLDSLPDLKIVCKHGVGVDNIDVKAAQDRGVVVTNVPNANKHAVADFFLAGCMPSLGMVCLFSIIHCSPISSFIVEAFPYISKKVHL